MLEIACDFYTVETIKGFIDVIAVSCGTFLHLHASEKENYALENDLLEQTLAHAVVNSDGSYSNPARGTKILSTAQPRLCCTRRTRALRSFFAHQRHLRFTRAKGNRKQYARHALLDAVYELDNLNIYYNKPLYILSYEMLMRQ